MTQRRDPSERLAVLDAVFAALDHPARRQILLTVHFRGTMTAGQIAGRFEHAWPTTTRHMRVLEAAGLLSHEKQGRARLYRVNRDRLDVLREWLAWFYRDAAAAQHAAPGNDGDTAITASVRGDEAGGGITPEQPAPRPLRSAARAGGSSRSRARAPRR